MPLYDYFCPSNQEQIEVSHPLSEEVKTWGQLCKLVNRPPGNTPEDAPVRRLISAPRLLVPTSNNDYKSLGFNKYVKRDEGVYENVTASEGDSRIVNREGKPIQA